MFDSSSPLSLSTAMLQAVFKSPEALGDSVSLVKAFYEKQRHCSGLFCNRKGKPDLYYSVFGLSASICLGIDLPWESIQASLLHHLIPYPEKKSSDMTKILDKQFFVSINALASTNENMEKNGSGTFLSASEHPTNDRLEFHNIGLDYIHLCCLIRCLALTRIASDSGYVAELAGIENIVECLFQQLERYRAKDGGYSTKENSANGTAYGSFLALGAYQDWHQIPPHSERMVASLSSLARAGGCWVNENAVPLPSVQATAACISILHYLNKPLPEKTAQWFSSMVHPQGGLRASQLSPMPDLLSTGVGLFALSLTGENLLINRESCLDFADSLWSNEGGFHGHWADDYLDVEYTFYGLLTLGLLGDVA